MNAIELVTPYLPLQVIDQVEAWLEINDTAHNREHVHGVVIHANEIIGKFPELERFRKEIIVAAYLHDSHCWKSRARHHELAASHAGALLPTIGYSESEVTMIHDAILMHRASFNEERYSQVADVVAAADRGKFDRKEGLKRAIQYRLGKVTERVDISIELLVMDALDHLWSKYSKKGYVWKNLPHYSTVMYGKEISEMQAYYDRWRSSSSAESIAFIQEGVDIYHEITNGGDV